MGSEQRGEFQEALLDADGFEDLPGKWQAAIVVAEQNRPDLRIARSAGAAGISVDASSLRTHHRAGLTGHLAPTLPRKGPCPGGVSATGSACATGLSSHVISHDGVVGGSP
jgi:hypothetical protein